METMETMGSDHSATMPVPAHSAMAPIPAHSAMSPTSNSNRGKHQIHWSEGVWRALDHAVMHEMMRTRVAAKFLPHVHVDRKQTTIAADVVNIPTPPAGGAPFDPALSVDESATNRIQEYWTTFRLSVAQVDAEEHEEMAMAHHGETPHHEGPGVAGHHQMAQHQMSHPHRATTAVSLAMRTANVLAQAEDLILFNGQNAVQNSPLFINKSVQFLDTNLATNLDTGLLNINSSGTLVLPNIAQVIVVHPAVAGTLRYAENTLNAVAQGFSVLQGLAHYESYALALHTFPYADMHQALAATLIEPVEPISHLIKAGIHGSGTLPPFTADPSASLPKKIIITGVDQTAAITGGAKILYTGVLVSLSGNTMDHVRGRMEDHLDVIVTFNQKDANEQYRFRVVQRFALRLKDPTAVVVFLFLET